MIDLTPKTIPVILPGLTSKRLWQDQYENIVDPAISTAKRCLKEEDKRLQVIHVEPGGGKTTVFEIDTIWRIALEAKKEGRENQLIVITAPDDGVVQEIYSAIKETYDNQYYYLKDNGLSFYGIYQNPKEVKGRELEIVVCTMQKLIQEKQHEHLKQYRITLFLSDEVHKGTGSPNQKSYLLDVGYEGKDYKAVWYNKCRELQYDMWIGLTGTPTHSQQYNEEEYNLISTCSDKMSWRLPFYASDLELFDPIYPRNNSALENFLSFDDKMNQIERFFVELSQRNAIGRYLKEQIKNIDSVDRLSETKVTGLIRCGIASSKFPNISDVLAYWKVLCKKYKDKTFDYEGNLLPYFIGKIGELSSQSKPGKTNLEAVDILNNENNDIIAYAVMYIGNVGINIENLGVISILPVVKNKGYVDLNLRQLIARMDRCKFIWKGPFAQQVAEINDSKQRELMIKLAINSASRKCFATRGKGGLTQGAYHQVKDSHIMIEHAYGYLEGIISTQTTHYGTSSTSGKERDLDYKNARKDRCEYPGCTCYEDLVLNADDELTKSEREINYIRSLQVDHIDGNRENMNPDNLWTLCPNRHSMKTMQNQDYLNNYVDND